MPGMAPAWSFQVSLLLKTWYTPKPMMPTASSPTTVKSAIGPQLRPWLTFTGVTGGRPPPLPPPALVGVADLLAGLAPVAGREDGRRLPPVCGLLMLMGPRRDRYGQGCPGAPATSRIVTGTSGRHQVPKCTPASIDR